MTALWIALGTVREAARGRVVRGFAVLAAALLIAVSLLPSVAPEDRAIMLARLLVGAAGIVATVSLAFVGSAAVSDEIERGQLAVVLAKPVSRTSYVLGRALGVAALAPLLLGGLYGLAVAVFFASTRRSLPADFALTHPERETVGAISAERSSLEYRFDGKALAAEPEKLRLRVQAEDARIPRVPILLEISSDGAPAPERRLLLAGSDIVRDLDLKPAFTRGTDLRVRVTAREGDTALRADRDAAVLIGRAGTGFSSNLARAFVSLAEGAALLGAVGVAASAALSGRLALVFTLAMLLAGSLVESIRGFGRFLSTGAPLLIIEAPGAAAAPPPGPARVFGGHALEWLAGLLPDLSRFDLSGSLIAGREIRGALLAQNGAYALVYAAACGAIACLAFRGREVVR